MLKRRIMATMGALALIVAAVLSAPGAAQAAVNLFYAGGQQTLTGGSTMVGAVSNILVTRPYLATTGTSAHAVTEISVQQGSGATRQLVEIGFALDAGFGDSDPHLFASRWVNNTWAGCYFEGCGWVDATPADSTDDLGRNLASVASDATFTNRIKKFQVQHDATNACSGGPGWWFYYGGTPPTAIGCYPDTLWSGSGVTFTSGTFAQFFGEVASDPSGTPCTDMGNGKAGSSYTSPALDINDPAFFTSASLLPNTLTTSLGLFHTTSAAYDAFSIGSTGNKTFTFGGAGWTSGGATPGNIGSC